MSGLEVKIAAIWRDDFSKLKELTCVKTTKNLTLRLHSYA